MKHLGTIIAFCALSVACTYSASLEGVRGIDVLATKRRNAEAAGNVEIENEPSSGKVSINIGMGARNGRVNTVSTSSNSHASELSASTTSQSSVGGFQESTSSARSEKGGLNEISINLDDLINENHLTIDNNDLGAGGSVHINLGGLRTGDSSRISELTSSSASSSSSAKQISVENASVASTNTHKTISENVNSAAESVDGSNILINISGLGLNAESNNNHITESKISTASSTKSTTNTDKNLNLENYSVSSNAQTAVKTAPVTVASNNAARSNIHIHFDGLGVDAGESLESETKTSKTNSNTNTATQFAVENRSVNTEEQIIPVHEEAEVSETSDLNDNSKIEININGLGFNHPNTESTDDQFAETKVSTASSTKSIAKLDKELNLENQSVISNTQTVLETTPLTKPSSVADGSNIHIHFDGYDFDAKNHLETESKSLTTSSNAITATDIAVENRSAITEEQSTPAHKEVDNNQKSDLVDGSKIQININGQTNSESSLSEDVTNHVNVKKTNLISNTDRQIVEAVPISRPESRHSNIHIYIHELDNNTDSELSEPSSSTSTVNNHLTINDTSRQTVVESSPISDLSSTTATHGSSQIQVTNESRTSTHGNVAAYEGNSATASANYNNGFGQLDAIHITINGISGGSSGIKTEKVATTTEQANQRTSIVTERLPVTTTTENTKIEIRTQDLDNEDQSDEVEIATNTQVNSHHENISNKIHQKLASKYNWVVSKHAAIGDHFKRARIVNKPVQKFDFSAYLNGIIQKKLNALNKLFTYKKSLFAHKFNH